MDLTSWNIVVPTIVVALPALARAAVLVTMCLVATFARRSSRRDIARQILTMLLCRPDKQ